MSFDDYVISDDMLVAQTAKLLQTIDESYKAKLLTRQEYVYLYSIYTTSFQEEIDAVEDMVRCQELTQILSKFKTLAALAL